MYLRDFICKYIKNAQQEKSSALNSVGVSHVNDFLCDVVNNKVQETINVLCTITVNILVSDKQSKNKSPFLGYNTCLKGALGLLIHMIIVNHENMALKWATKSTIKMISG